MTSMIYWQAWPAWRRWLLGVITLLVVSVFWFLHLFGWADRELLLLVFFVWSSPPDWVASDCLMVAGSILLVNKGTTITPVPLAVAQVERHPSFWLFRWEEGRKKRKRRIASDPASDALLEKALEQVRAASAAGEVLPSDPWRWPTVLHEGGPPLGGYLRLFSYFALIGLLGSAARTNPLLALPVIWALYAHRAELPAVRYALTADGLWVAWPGREAQLIPAEQIIKVTGTKRRVRIRTRNPWCPVVSFGTSGLAGVTLDWMERTRFAGSEDPK